MKTDLLLLAGYGHFGILLASIQVPRVLDWRSELAGLHPFVRQLFWVYGVFIVFTIAALGTLTLMNLQALVEGDAVARSLAGFTSLFWALRLVVQVHHPRDDPGWWRGFALAGHEDYCAARAGAEEGRC
jgi:hypothetical protein